MKFSVELRCVAAALALCLAGTARAETLRNDDVVALLEAGLGEEAVIAKIETSDGDFVTDTKTLLALRAKGVPSPVIAAMVKSANGTIRYNDTSPDPTVPHTPGFYMLDEAAGQPRMLKIDPIASTQTKTGGILGYALTGGIASASLKAVLPGATAQTQTGARKPTFYVFFDAPGDNQSAVFSTGFGNAVISPNEFSLINLMEKKERREARVGSLNIAGSKTGVMDKDQVPFSYEQVTPTVYKITLLKDSSQEP
ncbi:hypothetical protein C0V72_11735 [Porphyrobacter sp. TH134]|uniref:hypothetical protein n=1 Tax=Porphyrobacter sp. TH134 TaxID=2067450 RepID=UPI000C7CBE70|nr:hypothetical protein [Porphyrobacter sp. TH134]PLK23082.1 hypothetical protein C0V72_11735 [Porphyrobacter sp. TH134]